MVSAEFCSLVERVYAVNGITFQLKDLLLKMRAINCKELYHQASGSDFIHKVAQTFGTRVLTSFIGLVTSVMISRALGPEGRGSYSIAVTIGAIAVQLCNLGLHASNTYHLTKERFLLPVLLSNSLVVGFGFGGMVAFASWLVFSLKPDWAPVSGVLLNLALVGIPLSLVYLLIQNLLIGIQEISIYNQIELVTKLGGMVLIGFVLLIHYVSVQLLFSISIVTTGVAIIYSVVKLKPYINQTLIPSWKFFKKGLLYGFKAYLAALFSFLVLRIDLFLITYVLGKEQAGYYSVAVNLTDIIYLLPVVISTILFPKLSAIVDNTEKWLYTKKVAWAIVAIMVCITSFSGIFSGFFVRLLFGDAFLPATDAFNWLLPSIVLLSANTVFMNYFASIGMPWITVYSPGIAMLMNILINLILIPTFGIVGASMSSIITYGMMLIISVIYIRKGDRHGARISEETIY